MTTAVGAQCTCSQAKSRNVHHPNCDLWCDVDFTMETKVWDFDKWELVDAPTDHQGLTDTDWYDILAMTNQPLEPFEKADGDTGREPVVAKVETKIEEEVEEAVVVIDGIDYKHGVPDPDQFWDLKDGPPEGLLVCFCTPPKWGLFCGPCGLSRKTTASPWEPSYWHKQEISKTGVVPCTCEPQCRLTCYKNNVQRWSSGSERWVFWDKTLAYQEANNSSTGWKNGKWQGGSSYSYTPKCRHKEVEVVFPNGVAVYASSMFTRGVEDIYPDLGLYMADWKSRGVAYHVSWQDFGLPMVHYEPLRQMIEHGLAMAADGKMVEVGCVGGHGRTGSVLALMALHSGIDKPEDAIKWVKENYCKEAIEGEKQEWYISYYHARMNGEEPPPMPEPKKYTNTYTYSGSTTYKTNPNPSHTSTGGGGNGVSKLPAKADDKAPHLKPYTGQSSFGCLILGHRQGCGCKV